MATAGLQKRYSKTKALANRIIWTPNEVMQVPFTMDGILFDSADLAVMRVLGRDMFCLGYRVDFRVPASAHTVRISTYLFRGDNVAVTGSTLNLYGITPGDTKLFSPNVPFPANSIWKFRVAVDNGTDEQVPQGITITYYMRYANGPVDSSQSAFDLLNSGVGYWQVGKTFVVI